MRRNVLRSVLLKPMELSSNIIDYPGCVRMHLSDAPDPDTDNAELVIGKRILILLVAYQIN